MEPEEYTKRAHKVAFAISRKCNIEVTVRRIPLTKTLLGFGFVCGAYYTVFGQSFLDGNLATFATRIMEEIQGKRHAIGKHGKIHGN
jgi:hypothetical protein